MTSASVAFLIISLLLHAALFGSYKLYKWNTTSQLSFQRQENVYEIHGNDRVASTSDGKSSSQLETATPESSTFDGGAISDGSELGISPPIYPRQSRLNGEEGSVLLGLTLKGNFLCEVKVLESSGFERLDNSAILSIKNGLKAAHDCIGAYSKRIRFSFGLK